jgi:septum formation protein
MSKFPHIYLASRSPRRQQLLQQINVPFTLLESIDVDEQALSGEAPGAYATRLAAAKAAAGLAQLEAGQQPLQPVLGADTCIAHAGEILGKPRDRAHALEMLQRLAGDTHEVLTAICLAGAAGQQQALSVSHVTFAPLSMHEIEAYWETGEPADKAGAYAIQGYAACFVSRLVGSYSGVVGLPLYELSQILRASNES